MKKKSDYTTLLFDLDGTLVDSGEGIMKCAQYSLAHFGIVMDMGVGETAAAHKEYLNAQQHNCQPHNSQCQ